MELTADCIKEKILDLIRNDRRGAHLNKCVITLTFHEKRERGHLENAAGFPEELEGFCEDINLDEEFKFLEDLYDCNDLNIEDDFMFNDQVDEGDAENKEAQQNDGKYPCGICKLIFTTNSYLQRHLTHCRKRIVSPAKKKHKCNECDYQTDKYYSLKLHKLTHSSVKRFTCDLCKKGFNRCDTYRHHMFEHENQKKPFQCAKCDYSAISRTHLKSHVSYKHSDEKPLQCGVCSYRCINTSGLKSHMLTHRSDVDRIKCDHCEYSTSTRRKRNLLEHIKRKHSTDRPFQCDFCVYKAVTTSALKQHLKNKHSRDKRHKCSICAYQTMRVGDYVRHVERKHLLLNGCTEKLLRCDECDFSTAYKSSLGNHKKTVHSAEKPFRCDFCDYKSATVEYLKRHVYTHSEGKPFKCTNCKYQTFMAQRLMKHFEIKHLEKRRQH